MEITEEVLDVIASILAQEYGENKSYVVQDVSELANYNLTSCRLEASLGIIELLKGLLRDDEAMIEVLKDYLKED